MNRARGRRSVLWRAASVLGILLPVVSAWYACDVPPAPGEWQLVQAIHRAEVSPAVLACMGGALPEQLPAAGTEGAEALLRQLRGVQLGWLAAMSGLCWLVARQALGHPFPLFACALLALLGPVEAGGGVLRPEVPGSVFGMLGVLLLQLLPGLRPPRVRRWARYNTLALVMTSGCALGMAIALCPASASWLLVPALLLLLVFAGLCLQTGRVLWRRGWPSVPLRAVGKRVLPWVLLPMSAMGSAVSILGAGSRVSPLTTMESSLLPTGVTASALVVLLAAAGGLILLFGIGTSLGRPRRLGAVIPMFACCAVQVLNGLMVPRGFDTTSACVPLALLAAQGAALPLVAVLAVRGWKR